MTAKLPQFNSYEEQKAAEIGQLNVMFFWGVTVHTVLPISIFVLHMTAKLPQFSSYEKQQEAEIGQLNVKFSGSPHVLLGDLNTGPER